MGTKKVKEEVPVRKYAGLNITEADNGFYVIDYAAVYSDDKHMVFSSKKELCDYILKRFK